MMMICCRRFVQVVCICIAALEIVAVTPKCHGAAWISPQGQLDGTRRRRQRGPPATATTTTATATTTTTTGLFLGKESDRMERRVPVDETVEIRAFGDERSIATASEFMIDAFWLGSGRLVPSENDDDPSASASADAPPVSVSPSVRNHLLNEQMPDLVEKYGERMGKRALDSRLFFALDGGDPGAVVGMAGLEVTLLDRDGGDILSYGKAESSIRDAVSSLGPKDRRRYKDADAKKLAGLVGPGYEAVCCLSNVAVSPDARRRGIARSLCERAERVALNEMGFPSIFLKVECGNLPARKLYEGKLGYRAEYEIPSAPAMRFDTETGNFVQIQADTLILSKEL